MKYLFTQGRLDEDGSFAIHKDKVDMWKRQIFTDYDVLTEKEKNLIDIVKKFILLI